MRITFARPFVLDHSATGTRRQWSRLQQAITFVCFHQHSFGYPGGRPFTHRIDSVGIFARLAAAGHWLATLKSVNGANGRSDMVGCAATVAARESGDEEYKSVAVFPE